MRSREDLFPHQGERIGHAVANPQQMLWDGMGSGKTASALTITHDRKDRLEVYGTLVVAPLRVCQLVWMEEAHKWDYLRNLTFSHITGTPTQRHRRMRMRADIYLINYELVEWLVDELIAVYLSKGKYLPFNQLIADEISKWKDPTSNRHTAIRKLLAYVPYRIGLTGTPASNGYGDLFGQFMVVDSGKRLGVNITDFRKEFFTAGGYGGYSYELNVNAEDLIKQRIADITLQYAPERHPDELPIINDIWVKLPPAIQESYDKLEREMFLEFDNGKELEVFNAAALSMKLRQHCNGACFIEPEDPRWEPVHDIKLKALDEVIEEAAGAPVLVTYQFRHDLERIQKRYPEAVYFGGKLSKAEALRIVADWQAGRIPLLLGHAKSLGYGTDGLQYGGHIETWFGLTWSLDDYQQTIARLDRTGQAKRVTVHRILALNTIDMVMSDRLVTKGEVQEDLTSTINAYRKMKGV